MIEKSEIRRPFLSALCVLTFIGSGVGFIGYFLASLFYEKTSEIIIKYSSWDSVEKITPTFFILLMVFYCLSLAGAIKIWKLHKTGFYIYMIAQIFILFLPPIWIGWMAFSITNTIFTFIFIGGYLLNYKQLK